MQSRCENSVKILLRREAIHHKNEQVRGGGSSCRRPLLLTLGWYSITKLRVNSIRIRFKLKARSE